MNTSAASSTTSAGGSGQAKKTSSLRAMKRGRAGWAIRASMTSVPSRLPLRPRTSLSPWSWASALKWNFAPSRCQPVKARAASRTSFSRVIADAEGEQFHQFAGEVLVGILLRGRLAVEVDEHGRVAADGSDEVAEVAPGEAAQRLALAVHQEEVIDLAVAGGEVAVPEQRQLLAQRRPRGQHAVAPPRLQLAGVAEVGEAAAEAPEGVLKLGLLVLAVVEEVLDGAVAALLDGAGDLGRGGAEAGAAEQVGGGAGVPGGVRCRGPGASGP